MAVGIREMAEALRRRERERAARAAHRADRIRAVLPAVRDRLTREYGVSSVCLFGSLATGSVREGSDVDLAVEGLAPERYFDALSDLMALVGGPVDLVRLEDAPPGLADRIREEGRAL